MAVRVVLLRSFMGMEDLRPLFRYFRRSLGISAWSVYNRRREREAAVDGGVLGRTVRERTRELERYFSCIVSVPRGCGFFWLLDELRLPPRASVVAMVSRCTECCCFCLFYFVRACAFVRVLRDATLLVLTGRKDSGQHRNFFLAVWQKKITTSSFFF